MNNEPTPERKENPGKSVFAYGILTLCVYAFGGLFASKGYAPFFGVLLGILVVTLFLASVVGAYYAGKRRR